MKTAKDMQNDDEMSEKFTQLCNLFELAFGAEEGAEHLENQRLLVRGTTNEDPYTDILSYVRNVKLEDLPHLTSDWARSFSVRAMEILGLSL